MGLMDFQENYFQICADNLTIKNLINLKICPNHGSDSIFATLINILH